MASPVPLTELAEVLRLGPREMVSIVGGGGKTTVLTTLGRQLPGRRIVTTTTKMALTETGGFEVLLDPSDSVLDRALEEVGCVVVWRRHAGPRAVGFPAARCEAMAEFADHVLVEADGSAGLPFKAPRPLEPVIPQSTTTFVACIGADALGRVIADRCHRPLRVAAVAGCSPYERLTPERAARVLLDSRGSRKDCPDGARFVVVVNKVSAGSEGLAAELVEAISGSCDAIQVPFDEAEADPLRASRFG